MPFKALIVVAACGVIVAQTNPAAAQIQQTAGNITIPAAAMTFRLSSSHNRPSYNSCGQHVPTFPLAEADGHLISTGSFLSPVQLPFGAVLQGFFLFAATKSPGFKSHAYLVRTAVTGA